MHASVHAWVAEQVTAHGLGGRVLEVGSYDENGSVRGLFGHAVSYLGVDMRPGPGVDRVASAAALPFEPDWFDVIVSTEMLEHDARFWLSLAEMGRVLTPGGRLLVTARGNGFPEHAYPDDYWRFMPSAGRLWAELAGCQVVTCVTDPDPASPGLLLHAAKSAH